jgi:hypothetical protein
MDIASLHDILYMLEGIIQLCSVYDEPIKCVLHLDVCIPKQIMQYPDYRIDDWLENCIELFSE